MELIIVWKLKKDARRREEQSFRARPGHDIYAMQPRVAGIRLRCHTLEPYPSWKSPLRSSLGLRNKISGCRVYQAGQKVRIGDARYFGGITAYWR